MRVTATSGTNVDWRDEGGASTGEYIAVSALAVALIIFVAPTTVAETIGETIRSAFCLVGDVACDVGDQRALTDEDFRPDACDVSERSYQGDVDVSVAFFTAQAGMTFARTERSDGTTEFTLVDDGGVGLTAGVGAEVEYGPGTLGATADASAGLVAEEGASWVVGSSDADALQDRLIKGEGLQQTVGRLPLVGDPLASWAGDLLFGELAGPDKVFIAAGVEAELTAGVELEYLGQQVAGASTGVESTMYLGQEQNLGDPDPENWTYTDYFEVSMTASGDVSWVAGEVGGEVGMTSVARLTQDAQGNLVEIELVNSVSGTQLAAIGSNLPETTALLSGAGTASLVEKVTVPLDDAAAREEARLWLSGTSPDPDAFHQLVADEARVSLVGYEGTESGLSVGAKAALGAKLGARGGFSTSTSTAVEAYYLGAPTPSGDRDLVTFTDCVG